jgi:hypothetical protein
MGGVFGGDVHAMCGADPTVLDTPLARGQPLRYIDGVDRAESLAGRHHIAFTT